MVKFVAQSPSRIFCRPRRKASRDYANPRTHSIAKFSKTASSISRALLAYVRANPGSDDLNYKNIDTMTGKNEDSYNNKLKIAARGCWKDVLRIQWLLILQGIVIIIVILTMGTWMGHEYNEAPIEDSSVALWRSIIERLQDAIIDIGTEYRPCYHDTDTHRRRANILKRRRI